jgi:3-hydroxy-3-methylglutaryl CoA synthase
MRGITSIGTYLPRLRMSRAAIAGALGWLVPGISAKGHRASAYWDENSTTMGVEAARIALRSIPETPSRLAFVTSSPVYAEPQNAATVHRALRLPASVPAQDVAGAGRGCLTALAQQLDGRGVGIVVAADRHVGPAGSAFETRFADGAAAAIVGEDDLLFEYLAVSDLTSAFVDRYRPAGRHASVNWEERWIREEGVLKQVPVVIGSALQKAGIEPNAVRHLVMPSTIAGTGSAVARACGLANASVAETLLDRCGDIGSGHTLLMLAHASERMAPDDIVIVAQFGQGATALVLKRTARAMDLTATVSGQLDNGIVEENYLKLPLLAGTLEWERGLRGRNFSGEALSTAHRYEDALLGFLGERSGHDGEVRFPPTGAEEMEHWPLADRGGRIATITADQLAFSLHPPSCYGLVDFDGGGRLMMDITDPRASAIGVGDPVRFVFRVHDADPATGHVRYFWKAVGADQPDREAVAWQAA